MSNKGRLLMGVKLKKLSEQVFVGAGLAAAALLRPRRFANGNGRTRTHA
jgi:hypothetical protein